MPDEGSISADPAVHVDILLGIASKHRWSCLAEVHVDILLGLASDVKVEALRLGWALPPDAPSCLLALRPSVHHLPAHPVPSPLLVPWVVPPDSGRLHPLAEPQQLREVCSAPLVDSGALQHHPPPLSPALAPAMGTRLPCRNRSLLDPCSDWSPQSPQPAERSLAGLE